MTTAQEIGEAIDVLVMEYTEWLNVQQLPEMSADELYFEDCVNDEQRGWLAGFIKRWDDTLRDGP